MKKTILLGLFFISTQSFAANLLSCKLKNLDQGFSVNVEIDLDTNSILGEYDQMDPLKVIPSDDQMVDQIVNVLERGISSASESAKVALNVLKTNLNKGLPLLVTGPEHGSIAAISIDPSTKSIAYVSMAPGQFIISGVCH